MNYLAFEHSDISNDDEDNSSEVNNHKKCNSKRIDGSFDNGSSENVFHSDESAVSGNNPKNDNFVSGLKD